MITVLVHTGRFVDLFRPSLTVDDEMVVGDEEHTRPASYIDHHSGSLVWIPTGLSQQLTQFQPLQKET